MMFHVKQMIILHYLIPCGSECLLNIKNIHRLPGYYFIVKTEQKYEILIQDNGNGFTMEEAEDKANSHFGLALIHEGVNLLNGTIHVSSAIGRGTSDRY